MIKVVTTQDTVEQYVDDVLSGRVVACKIIKKAVAKYQTEMQRHDIDWEFHFDEHAATMACQFFPKLLWHSIAEWAGRPFELSPWQQFIMWNLFGWKRQDGTRRFRRLFLSVGRKNGKSSLCAGLAIMLAGADGEAGAQVFIGATKIDQARIIYQESDRMLRQSPFISKHAKILKDNIGFINSNSFIRPLGSDKPFDGLNPHGAFFDELHAWKEHHRKFFDTMVTGSGSRTQPMQVIITTSGDEKSQIYHEEADYARKVIEGEVIDNTLFAMIYEMEKEDEMFADDFDEANLIKANPGYGISVKPEYLSQQLREARNKPQSKNRFIRYHANRCVSSVEESMSAEIWDAVKGELSNWREADGVGAGVDLGGRDDLAAYALWAKFKIGEDADQRPLFRYETFSRVFVASDTKRDLLAEPFRTWIADGKLTVCDYVVNTLQQALIEDCQTWGVEYIAFDPNQATQLAENLEYEGYRPIKMPQIHSHFNETIAEYHAAISEGRFRPDQSDVVLRWCALNMAINRDSRDRMMPDKKHSKEKIDAAVAMLMAQRACVSALPRYTGSLVL